MKKVLILFTLSLMSFSALIAQNTLIRSYNNRMNVVNKFLDHSDVNKEKYSFKNTSEISEVEPYKVLDGTLDVCENVETGEFAYFIEKRQNSGYDITSITISFLDKDLNEDFNFSIQAPELCNSAVFSRQCNSTYYMIFFNYFEGSVSPENRKSEVWLVDRSGTVLRKIESNSVGILFEDKLAVFPLSEVGEGLDDVRILNAETFDEEKVFESLPLDNLMMLNAYTDFVNVDGQSYVIVPQFESMFFDQNNYEYFAENNHLILTFYSLEDYSKAKEVKVALEDIVDVDFGEDDFGMVVVEFGLFPNYKWDITTDKFNSDDKMEFIVGTSYEMFGSGAQYINYYVVNEDGDILKRLEENLSSNFIDHVNVLNDLEGYDDQIVFGQNTDDGMNLFIFNINSWTTQAVIPAVGNDELQLSVNSYRQPIDNGYKYLIASGTPTVENEDTENEKWYGHIKEFNSGGIEIKTINLNIEKRPFRYSPILTASIMLDPRLINEDEEVDYPYYVSYTGEPSCFYVAKDSEDPFFKWTDSEEYGTLGNPGSILDLETDISRWLQFQHTKDGATNLVTFELPLVKMPRSIETYIPAENASNVYLDQEVSVTFDIYIEEIDFSGITIKDEEDNLLTGISVTIQDEKTLNIAHDNFQPETKYTVTIPARAIYYYPEEISWEFTTGTNLNINVIDNNIVNIYPNPSSGNVNINVTQRSNIKIIDLTGKIIESYDVNENSEISFNQKPGMYFVEVNSEEGRSVHKIIIQ